MIKVKIAAILFLIVPLNLTSRGQEMKDIFDPDAKVTWLGLDFTGVKLIGDRERFGSLSDTRHLMEAWNDILVKERDKFNAGRAVDKKHVNEAIEVTKEHNANLELLDLFSDNKSDYLHLNPDHINTIVSEYDFKGNNGLGLMFIVESFSKLNGEASAWVTFVDMGSHKVVLTERVHGDPGGAGMRNYWANAIHDMMEKMRSKEFRAWRKRYIGK